MKTIEGLNFMINTVFLLVASLSFLFGLHVYLGH